MKDWLTPLNIATGAFGAYTAGRRAYRDWSAAQGGKQLNFGSGSRTQVVTMRRRNEQLPAYGDLTRYNRSIGRRPRRNVKQAWKRLDATEKHTVFAYRQYGPWGGTNGLIPLANTSPTLITGLFTPPMVLFELTSCINVAGTPAGSTVVPNIGWSPQFSDPTAAGNLSWNSGNPLTLEKASLGSNIATNYPTRSSILDWIQIKSMFYHPTTKPTRITVQLVSFNDERLCPGATVTAFSTAFYQSLIKKYSYNPVEPGDSEYKKYLKVWHTVSWLSDAKETTDSSVAKYREVNIFKRFNRRCKYDWNQDDAMAMGAQDGQINQGDMSTQVHPRARIYLLIRAQCINGTAYSNLIHPSYDLVIRTRHSGIV